MSTSNYPRGAVTCSESIRITRSNKRRIMLSTNAKVPIFVSMYGVFWWTNIREIRRDTCGKLIYNDKVNLTSQPIQKAHVTRWQPKSRRWIQSSSSLTVSMASSAASALPAWVDRRERCLDANGPPTRRLRINHQHQHQHNRSPPQSHNHRIDLFGSLAHGSHHDPMPARVFPSARPCTRSPPSLSRYPDRSERSTFSGQTDRRRFDRLPKSVTVDRVLPLSSSFLSSSLLRALVRRTPAIRATRYHQDRCTNKAMNTRGMLDNVRCITNSEIFFWRNDTIFHRCEYLREIYWWLNLTEKLFSYELNVANDIYLDIAAMTVA